MAETKITINNSGSQVSHSNPSVQPLAVGAGATIIAAPKSVSGQVPNTSVVFRNPA